jgi:capsule polysaccharide modification protein KpsS
MKEEFNSLITLATHARDYVKRAGIEPIDKYIDFGNHLSAYCTEDYSFFSMSYNNDTRVVIFRNDVVDRVSVTIDGNATVEDLKAIHAKAFETIFQYEQNSSEVLEKQKIAQIAELESKLAKLRDL